MKCIFAVAGVRRGCVKINVAKYGDATMISDTESIQEIFDFTLDEGDEQKGTATFCETSACNTEDVTVTGMSHCSRDDAEIIQTTRCPFFQEY